MQLSLFYDFDSLLASIPPAFFEATTATTANPGDADDATAISWFSISGTTRTPHHSKSKSTSVGVRVDSGNKKDKNNRGVTDCDIEDQLGYFGACLMVMAQGRQG